MHSRTAEFQAVILAAGRGSRMPELTGSKPKCLLPIGNKPMIWYPLQMLENCGIQDLFMIVLESERTEIQTALEKIDLKIKIDYVNIPNNEDMGTADSLRLLTDKISSDLIVLSCDLITNVSLADALGLFRKHNASLCTLFFKAAAINQQLQVPGPKTKYKPERDIVGIDAVTNRLVFLASASDFEETVSLPRKLLKKHTNLLMHTRLVDSHLYIFKNWIVKYLQHESSISTIKGELLPHIIKKQLAKPTATEDNKNSIINIIDKNDIFYFAKDTNELEGRVADTSSYNDHTGDTKCCYHNDLIRCYAFVADSECFGRRVNSIPAFWEVNNQIIDVWPSITSKKELTLIDPKAEIKSNQVDNKCIIWESTKLNEKTSFKNSIIGANCQVDSFSRVFNSILMNNVVIQERVALENCIVCDGSVVKSGSQIKSCLIGSEHVVHENSIVSNEVLTDSDRLMEF